MEISEEGGLVVPGVPSPVPSLFPESGVLDNQNETREPGTLFIEGEDKCLGDGGLNIARSFGRRP